MVCYLRFGVIYLAIISAVLFLAGHIASKPGCMF
jgi:hypothetical protein